MTALPALDALLLRAHPAREVKREADLLLQATGGYTRRANSGVPMTWPVASPGAALAAAEAFYARHDLPVTFRLPSFADDPALRDVLGAAGLAAVNLTRVMTCEAFSLARGPATTDGAPALSWRLEDDVASWCRLHDDLSGGASGAAAGGAVNGASEGGRDERFDLLNRIKPARLLARMTLDKQPVAAGIAVVDGDWAGLYSLVVRTDLRGQGLGKRFMQYLIASASAHGARHAYLQVGADNPAGSLYQRMGFVERYRYAYYVNTTERRYLVSPGVPREPQGDDANVCQDPRARASH